MRDHAKLCPTIEFLLGRERLGLKNVSALIIIRYTSRESPTKEVRVGLVSKSLENEKWKSINH